MTTRDKQLTITRDHDRNSFACEIRREYERNGQWWPDDPVSLDIDSAEFGGFAVAFSADVVARVQVLDSMCNAFATQRDEAVAARDAALSQIAERDARIAELLAELDAIRNPPGPDTSTAEGLKAYLASHRYDIEVSGITIGDQFISTNRDELPQWIARYFNAQAWLAGDRSTNPSGLYPYKPKGGATVAMLTAEQSVRAFACINWYVNMCIATEGQLIDTINAGMPLDQAKVLIDNTATWPQWVFDWTPPAA